MRGLLFSTRPAADVQAVVAREGDVNFGQVFEDAAAQELLPHAFGRRSPLFKK